MVLALRPKNAGDGENRVKRTEEWTRLKVTIARLVNRQELAWSRTQHALAAFDGRVRERLANEIDRMANSLDTESK